MKVYRDLDENPLFERVDCPVCGNSDLRSTFTITYGELRQKPSLDYSNIGVGPETVFNIDESPRRRLVLANPRIKPEHQDLPYNESKRN